MQGEQKVALRLRSSWRCLNSLREIGEGLVSNDSYECGRMSYYCTTTKTFGPTYTTSQRFKTVAELHDLECAAEKRPLFLGQPSI
ncbi:hypothetical protein Y032_0194g1446 [Ancylostoma ceylanicum]|uniref:Uncharacterized protein n=1 Tax=Ancylostoma ceylanicum TaxID=53326 RepID=A0A016SPA3_9BILA|nr:hypothetical protein Y032_0194g1446 [Ancylostoma ceylanicum]